MSMMPATEKCPKCDGNLIEGDTDIVCQNVECSYRILKVQQQSFVSYSSGPYVKTYDIKHQCSNCGHFVNIDIKVN